MPPPRIHNGPTYQISAKSYYPPWGCTHRSSQGCNGCICTHQGGEKKLFRRNLQGKSVSAPPTHQVHPRGRATVNFRTFLAGRGRFGGLFSRFRPSFEGDFFEEKKCTPDNILAAPPGVATTMCAAKLLIIQSIFTAFFQEGDNNNAYFSQLGEHRSTVWVKKSSPLKLFAVLSLLVNLCNWKLSWLLPKHIPMSTPILVHLS